MGKKLETPPIDLSAKRGTIPKSPEAVARVVQSTPVEIRQAEIKPVEIRLAEFKPVEITPVESNGAKAGIRPTEDDVRVGAYFRWDAAGRPEGDGVHFWLQAEQEIIAGGAANAE